jgi:diguanylate cyclase (GGDEF)-like protein/PAS domain S-box-containing protein
MLLTEETRRKVADLVLETTAQGVWLIDDSSRTSFVNQHMAHMLGYSQHEMYGRHIFDFMDDEGRAICHRNMENRRNGMTDQNDFRFVRKDGRQLWVLMDTNPVPTHRGEYSGALAMVTDITAKKAAEEALRAERQNLELRVKERTSALEEANRQLAELATRDGLTGLYNHRHFQERLEQEIHRAHRYDATLSLLFMDVDHFKAYNDTYGHPEGDDLLRSLGQLLLAGGAGLLRSADFAARYGGEEFVIILPETELEGAVVVAERIRVAVQTYSFRNAHPQPGGRVTVSIGVAQLGDHEDSKSQLLASADAALYASKAAGRNRVTVAKPPAARSS